MDKNIWKHSQREKRAWRIRKRVRGTAQRPRLTVFRSLKHMYAQVVDDETGVTLCSASTVEKELREKADIKSWNLSAAQAIGTLLAERAKEKGITQVCFDRGSNKFHGRVKALAAAAREAGLKF